MSAPAPVPAPGVTLLDIYTRQIEMQTELALLGERLRAVPDHESRLRRLEESRARLIGACMALSAAASAAGTWLGLIAGRH